MTSAIPQAPKLLCTRESAHSSAPRFEGSLCQTTRRAAQVALALCPSAPYKHYASVAIPLPLPVSCSRGKFYRAALRLLHIATDEDARGSVCHLLLDRLLFGLLVDREGEGNLRLCTTSPDSYLRLLLYCKENNEFLFASENDVSPAA
jgi:hypothetical protein